MKKICFVFTMGILVCSLSAKAHEKATGINAATAFQPKINLPTNIRDDKTNVLFFCTSTLFSPSQQAKDLMFISRANN